jgi:hypothetical protein
VPTLILHGDDDQIVPIGASAMLSSKLIKNAKLKVYKGVPTECAPRRKTRSTPTCSPPEELTVDGTGLMASTPGCGRILSAQPEKSDAGRQLPRSCF